MDSIFNYIYTPGRYDKRYVTVRLDDLVKVIRQAAGWDRDHRLDLAQAEETIRHLNHLLYTYESEIDRLNSYLGRQVTKKIEDK